MKKTIKFKEKNGIIIISKKNNFSKKEKHKINQLLKTLTLINIEEAFLGYILSKKNKSIKIKHYKFKDIEETLILVNTYISYTNIRNINDKKIQTLQNQTKKENK